VKPTSRQPRDESRAYNAQLPQAQLLDHPVAGRVGSGSASRLCTPGFAPCPFIAIGAGVLIGVGAAESRLGPLLLEPLIRVLAPLPKIVFFPAFLLLLGFGSSSRIMLVVIDAIFPALLAAYFGARAIDEKLIWSARAAGMSNAACQFRVVLPAALPGILTGVRIAIVIGSVVVFLSEMVAPGDGLGDALIRAAREFQTVQMFVPLVTISLLGFILDYAVVCVRKTLVNW
jgi:ABC-type nitrate/sulfonate/bicarbonate transport system permease component